MPKLPAKGALTQGFCCRSGALMFESNRCRGQISVRMLWPLRLVFRKKQHPLRRKAFWLSHGFSGAMPMAFYAIIQDQKDMFII